MQAGALVHHFLPGVASLFSGNLPLSMVYSPCGLQACGGTDRRSDPTNCNRRLSYETYQKNRRADQRRGCARDERGSPCRRPYRDLLRDRMRWDPQGLAGAHQQRFRPAFQHQCGSHSCPRRNHPLHGAQRGFHDGERTEEGSVHLQDAGAGRDRGHRRRRNLPGCAGAFPPRHSGGWDSRHH